MVGHQIQQFINVSGSLKRWSNLITEYNQNMYTHQRTPSNISYHSNIVVQTGHGVYTRPTALLHKPSAKNLMDLSSTSTDMLDPNNSTPVIGYKPRENTWQQLSQSNLQKRPSERLAAQHMLTPTATKIRKADLTRTAYKSQMTDQTEVSVKASRISRDSSGMTVQERLRMENNHLKAENELMREELEYLRERFRKVLIEKHRPGCRELLS